MPFTIDNFLKAGLYLGIIAVISITAQLLFHKKILIGEYSRKLVHILTAFWIATWQFNLTQIEITYLGLILLSVIFLSKQFKIFNSVFEVSRTTYGEFTFVVGIMVANLVFDDPRVFALAIINLGLADGLAAIIGTRYGRKKYDVFGSTKSIEGMITSFVIVIMTGTLFWIFFAQYEPTLIFIVAHIVATGAVVSGLEFVSFKGLDNLSIPLATGLLYINLIPPT